MGNIINIFATTKDLKDLQYNIKKELDEYDSKINKLEEKYLNIKDDLTKDMNEIFQRHDIIYKQKNQEIYTYINSMQTSTNETIIILREQYETKLKQIENNYNTLEKTMKNFTQYYKIPENSEKLKETKALQADNIHII